ncbi:MAG: CHAT domain-containing protein [Verrucomicrobiales bacterium]|nr:CHAT domain-containing protein [Verrucomicrobiales bacterium]
MKKSGLNLSDELNGTFKEKSPEGFTAILRDSAVSGEVYNDPSRPDLEIFIAEGDIVHTTSRLILLGQFIGSEPSTAWRSVDEAMGNALSRLSKRQAGVGPRGSLDVVPTGRYFIMADCVAFLSLGSITDFDAAGVSLESAVENGVRGLLVCQTDEFATILIGDNPPQMTSDEEKVRFSLTHMLAGFLRALAGESEEGRRFRRLTIAETDKKRCEMIYRIIEQFRGEGFFNRFGVNYDVKIGRDKLTGSAHNFEGHQCNQLWLSSQSGSVDRISFTFRPWKLGAALLKETGNGFDQVSLQKIYRLVGLGDDLNVDPAQDTRPAPSFSWDGLNELSAQVTALIPESIRSQLARNNESDNAGRRPRLQFQDDNGSAAIPWECIRVGETFPALQTGVSRLFTSPKARVLESLPDLKEFRILLVINPTGDLRGAATEGRAIVELYRSQMPSASFELLMEGDATIASLTQKLNNNPYHVLHFAGHSGYSHGRDTKSSGLLMNDGFFTGEHASLLEKSPGLVVFNSCESARVSRLGPSEDGSGASSPSLQDAADGALTIAEAFITAGIGHFIGTFWPVQDQAAELFCSELYKNLVGCEKIGDAVVSARNALADQMMPDWANYIHYGDPEAVLFSK